MSRKIVSTVTVSTWIIGWVGASLPICTTSEDNMYYMYVYPGNAVTKFGFLFMVTSNELCIYTHV